MKRILTFCFMFSIGFSDLFGQYDFKYNNHKYSADKIADIIDSKKYIYNFQKGENVLSINSDRGIDEIIYSLESPALTFYLANSNQKLLNPVLIKNEIYFFNKTYGKTSKSDFLVIDEEKLKGKLADITFDKILINNNYFIKDKTNESLLLGLYSNLKVNGRMFVKIYLRTEANDNKALFRLAEMIKYMKTFGFVFVERYGYSDISEFVKLK